MRKKKFVFIFDARACNRSAATTFVRAHRHTHTQFPCREFYFLFLLISRITAAYSEYTRGRREIKEITITISSEEESWKKIERERDEWKTLGNDGTAYSLPSGVSKKKTDIHIFFLRPIEEKRSFRRVLCVRGKKTFFTRHSVYDLIKRRARDDRGGKWTTTTRKCRPLHRGRRRRRGGERVRGTVGQAACRFRATSAVTTLASGTGEADHIGRARRLRGQGRSLGRGGRPTTVCAARAGWEIPPRVVSGSTRKKPWRKIFFLFPRHLFRYTESRGVRGKNTIFILPRAFEYRRT